MAGAVALALSSGIDSEVKVWGVGEEMAPEQREAAGEPAKNSSRSWHQRMTENAPNVTVKEAKAGGEQEWRKRHGDDGVLREKREGALAQPGYQTLAGYIPQC